MSRKLSDKRSCIFKFYKKFNFYIIRNTCLFTLGIGLGLPRELIEVIYS